MQSRQGWDVTCARKEEGGKCAHTKRGFSQGQSNGPSPVKCVGPEGLPAGHQLLQEGFCLVAPSLSFALLGFQMYYTEKSYMNSNLIA